MLCRLSLLLTIPLQRDAVGRSARPVLFITFYVDSPISLFLCGLISLPVICARCTTLRHLPLAHFSHLLVAQLWFGVNLAVLYSLTL